MAGQNRGSAPTPSNPHLRGNKNQRANRKTQTRSEAFQHMLVIAQEQGVLERVRTGVSTNDALQLCLDRAVAIWAFAVEQVDRIAVELDEDGVAVGFFQDAPTPADPFRVVPSPWLEFERQARQDIETLATDMSRLGIAERQVRVAEAQIALVAAAVRDAAIEAGLTPDQVRSLGAALRGRLVDPATRAEVNPYSGEVRRRGDPRIPSPSPPPSPSTPTSPSPSPGGASTHDSPQSRPSLPSASRSQDPDTNRKASS